MRYLFFFSLLFLGCSTQPKKTVQTQKPNILFLFMDDLRPQLATYGSKMIHSPNIDELAKNSLKFNNAYSNVAVCGASRASILTGMLPTKTRFFDYDTFVEKETPEAITLPQLFKQNGYTTISNGKIFHHLDDCETHWNEVWRPYAFEKNDKGLNPSDYWQSLWKDYQLPENAKHYKETDKGPAYECAAVNDSIYIDGKMTEKVIRDIKKLKNTNKPFFLTAGFISPHLPFNAPKKYWDFYKREDIKQPYNNYVAKDAPKESISNWPEMRNYEGIPKQGQVNNETAITLIHGYYATVSYVDALIGKIIKTLKAEGLYENTIIVLVSDHGYNLQEHGQWAKFTSHEISSHVPFLVSSPKFRKKTESNALVDLTDIYPTLTELCSIENPKQQLDGRSLVSYFTNPNRLGKDYIFQKNQNGYTVKSLEYGYTEYKNPSTGKMISNMLYDHVNDKDENINLSKLPEYKEKVLQMQSILNTTFEKNTK